MSKATIKLACIGPEIRGSASYITPRTVTWTVYAAQWRVTPTLYLHVYVEGEGRKGGRARGAAAFDEHDLPEWLERPDEWIEQAKALVLLGLAVMSATARRNAIKAEILATADQVGPKSLWAQMVKRRAEHVVDECLAIDTSYDLRTINLNRWSPETRALIRDARASVTAAVRAMTREERSR